jgi:valyl-tRNA synthetase
MSKTKGNVVNPIEIVEQYGTDAVRFTLASMASPGTDIAFNVARTEGYRAFANKIWNAARFIFMNVDRAAEVGIKVDPAVLGSMPMVDDDAPLEARWVVAELHATAAKVNQALENYRFDDAANTIYQFFWGSFCDWYLEIVKLRLDFSETADKAAKKSALTTLVQVFECALRLLSPFMPFITEELWHAVYDGNPPAKSIALTHYPQSEVYSDSAGVQNKEIIHARHAYESPVVEVGIIQGAISALRAQRKEVGVPERNSVPARIYFNENGSHIISVLRNESNKKLCEYLAKVNLTLLYQPPSTTAKIRSEVGYDLEIVYEATVDVPAERERLTKDIARYEKGLAAAERQLGNEGFLAKAPAQIVEGLKKQEAETRLLLEKAQAALSALPKN